MLKNLKSKSIALILVLTASLALTFCGGAKASGGKPNIVILATGGTIAGAAPSKTQEAGYKAGAIGIQTLLDAVPEVKTIANVTGEQVVSIDSQNMNPDIWLRLATRINTLLKSGNVDGIVITHGTDTMEETAYFLNLTVKSDKPVVLTGSMRPSTGMSADGPLNLYNAVKVAAAKSSWGKGVLVSMNDCIFAARFVTKTNTTRVDTFQSRNQGPLGFVQNGEIKYYQTPLKKNTTGTPFSVEGVKAMPRVDIIYAFAGIPKDFVEHSVQAGAKGIVVAGMGDGGLGTILTDALSEAQKKGIVIVRSARVGGGLVTHNGDAEDDKLSFVSADDLNPQKARVLLQLALLKTNSPKAVQDMFYTY